MVFSMVDEGLGVIYPAGVGYDTVCYLKQKNIDLMEVPLDEVRNYACNLLAIEPGKVITTAGNPHTREQIEKRGTTVFEMSFEGGQLSGCGPICSTLPLIRDRGPAI